MSGFGRVIDGGSQMRKGVTKGINDKLEGFAKEQDRRAMLADAVKKAIYKGSLSEQKLNDVQVGQRSDKFGGKKGNNFTTPTKPSKV